MKILSSNLSRKIFPSAGRDQSGRDIITCGLGAGGADGGGDPLPQGPATQPTQTGTGHLSLNSNSYFIAMYMARKKNCYGVCMSKSKDRLKYRVWKKISRFGRKNNPK